MIGLMVIGGIILYLFIAYKVTFYIANKTKQKRYWIGIFLFFILLPTWDVIIGKIYFNYLCENQAGLKVYKSVEVDGYFRKGEIYLGKASLEKENNFKYKEGSKYFVSGIYKNKTMIQHLDLTNNSQIIELLNEPESEYEFIYNEKSKPLEWIPIIKNRAVVKHIKTDEVLGEDIGFIYFGSWISILLNNTVSGVNNPKERCLNRPYELLEQTLRKK